MSLKRHPRASRKLKAYVYSSGRTYWEELEEGIPSLGRSVLRLLAELGSNLSLFRLHVDRGISSNARVAKYSFLPNCSCMFKICK